MFDDLEYTYPIEEEFTFVAIDQAGNVWREWVQVLISVPELTIESIDYVGIGAQVHTQLSEDIDHGTIKFERNRMWYWEQLAPDTFSVKPLDPKVVWGLYAFDDSIVLHDAAWNTMCSIDTSSGEITLSSEQVETSVSFEEWFANVIITQSWWADWWSNELFSVRLQGASLWSKWVSWLAWGYTLLPLASNYVWWFGWGSCIAPTNDECHIFISEVWDVYIPAPYDTEYRALYRFEQWEVIYTILDATDKEIVEVYILPKPFW